MAAETGRAIGGRLAARIGVIAALSVERAGLDGAKYGVADITFHQSGPGAPRAEATARAAVTAGADALLAWGLAGGLVTDLAPGDVVLPERGLTLAGGEWRADARWHAALAAMLGAGFKLHTGALVSVVEVVTSPRDKEAMARSSGAVAVDMESAAVAAVAAEAEVAFAAVRVVADGSADALPADVAKWIDAAGNRRILPLLGAAVAPAEWPMLLKLASRYRVARRTLEGVAHCLLPSGFCATHVEARAHRS
jgi:adenosylhomocysteine nucleosidase